MTTNRREHDFYQTPPWCVDGILAELFPAPPAGSEALAHVGHWVDPCAGNGALIRAVDAWAARCEHQKIAILWQACEVAERHTRELQASLGRDSLGMRIGDTLQWLDPDIHYQRARFDVCFMNPPFKDAQAFCQWGIEHAQTTIALLRLGFLETSKRNPWLRANMPAAVYVLPNRPSFTGTGTDGTAYAWFVWRHNRIGRQVSEWHVLPDVPRKDRK